MKLIKQNDSAGGLIFKQNNNGKAMKQNYNFGNKSNIPTRSIHLEIPTLIGANFQNYTFGMWGTYDNTADDRHPKFFVQNSDASVILDFFEQIGNLISSVNFILLFLSPRLNFQRTFCVVQQNNISTNIFQLYIAKGGLRGTEKGVSDLDELVIYNRVMTATEINYMYNSGAGREPLTTQGLVCNIDFNNPIISGTNIIHEDRSGNGNHAVYMGLPVGTPEEQLQYVIDNLLEKW